MHLEAATETDTIDSGEHSDEPIEADIASASDTDEPVKTTTDITQPSYETPETLAETPEDSEEAFELLPLPTQITAEHSEIQADEETQTTIEPMEQSVEADQYNSEHSEQHTAEVVSDHTETSQELVMQADVSEDSEPSAPVFQDVPSHTNFTGEEETGPGSATRDTESALLHTERTAIAKAQNRPRPRTRKKSNRASVEKR